MVPSGNRLGVIEIVTPISRVSQDPLNPMRRWYNEPPRILELVLVPWFVVVVIIGTRSIREMDAFSLSSVMTTGLDF